MIPGTSALFGRKARSPVVTHLYSATNLGNTTSHNYASVPFGDASSDRLIVVCIAGYRNIAFTNTVTIGGISAPLIISSSGVSNYDTVGIYAAVVPTGTSGAVNITHSTLVDGVGISVFSVTNLLSTSVNDTGSTNGGTNASQTIIKTLSSQSVVIGIMSTRQSVGTYTVSGTGNPVLAVSQAGGAAVIMGSFSALLTAGGTNLNFSSQYSTTVDNNKMILAVWR